MNTTMLLTVTACLLMAFAVYFFMEYRAHGERDQAMSTILSLQGALAANTKKLTGLTRYLDHLAAGQKAIAERARPLTVKVVREYVHVEKLTKEKCRHGVLSSLVLKYKVEYVIGVDFKSENCEVVATTEGIEVKTGRPSLMSVPVVKPLSHELTGVGVLLDEPHTLKSAHEKFQGLASQYGTAVAFDELARAMYKVKVTEFLRDFLLGQPGVVQVPTISVVFR